jgi:Protein of unknown function (DUF3106)
MNRLFQIGSILLLVAGVTYGNDQQAKDQPSGPPPKTEIDKPAPPKGGVPKGGAIPPGAARLVNPNNIAVRLLRLSPEEREHALEKLPNEKARENARALFDWFDKLPKEEQQVQLRRLDHVAQLTPEQRAEVMGMIAEVNALPGPRSGAIKQALYRLQHMTDPQRDNVLRSPAFQERFSTEEMRLIRGLVDAWMGPGQ